MGRMLTIASGMFAGVIVGAALVLLFAPQSGQETRRLVQERMEAILAEGRMAAEEKRIELTAELDALKRSADQPA